jgi:hypothetical protein
MSKVVRRTIPKGALPRELAKAGESTWDRLSAACTANEIRKLKVKEHELDELRASFPVFSNDWWNLVIQADRVRTEWIRVERRHRA